MVASSLECRAGTEGVRTGSGSKVIVVSSPDCRAGTERVESGTWSVGDGGYIHVLPQSGSLRLKKRDLG